jgi:hypothetical protein
LGCVGRCAARNLGRVRRRSATVLALDMRGSAVLLGLVAISCDARSPFGARVAIDDAGQDVSAPEGSAKGMRPAFSDRDIDVRRRVETARAEFGGEVRIDIERDAFVFIGPPPCPLFDSTVALARKALDAYFNGRFGKAPDRAVAVYVFSSTPAYEAYCSKRFGSSCRESYGRYRPDSREIILDASPGLTTVAHELVHPIVHADFPLAPAWLNECLGALYENPTFPQPGEIHGATNWRRERLGRALASKVERPSATLGALFSMSDSVFRGPDEALHYSMARYACQWLDEQGELWPFYQAWRDNVSDDPTGAAAFAGVVGETPAQANGAWVKWLGER